MADKGRLASELPLLSARSDKKIQIENGNQETTINTTTTPMTTTTTTDTTNNLTIIEKDTQEMLEVDLSCAICQDVYINPLVLNCSHSFCKFCIYSWLTKHKKCPQCRVPVCFQAENLAIRNLIHKMVQKSSEQFQKTRQINVEQRLKDEETLSNEEQPEFLKNLELRTSLISAIGDSANSMGDNRIQFTNWYVSYGDSSGETSIESSRVSRPAELFNTVFNPADYRSDTDTDWDEYYDGYHVDDDEDIEDEDVDEDGESDHDDPNRDETFELDEDEELSDSDDNSGIEESESEISEHEALNESEDEMEVNPIQVSLEEHSRGWGHQNNDSSEGVGLERDSDDSDDDEIIICRNRNRPNCIEIDWSDEESGGLITGGNRRTVQLIDDDSSSNSSTLPYSDDSTIEYVTSSEE